MFPNNLVFDAEKQRIHKQGISEGFKRSLTLFMWVLHTKYGFGSKRIGLIVDEMIRLSDMIDEGYLTLKDIQVQLKEECGIEVIWDD